MGRHFTHLPFLTPELNVDFILGITVISTTQPGHLQCVVGPGPVPCWWPREPFDSVPGILGCWAHALVTASVI